MGGRVVQKYVEAPLLLPRCSQKRRLLKRSRCVDHDVRRRPHIQLYRGGIHDGKVNGVESCATARPWKEKENSGGNRNDSGNAANVQRTVCSDRLDAAETEPTISNDEITSPPGRTMHGPPGDTDHVRIDSSTSAGARKFDIRAWVLVTSWDPLEAYLFNQCYLRVCPQDFSLSESRFTDPQVHLTNLSARRPADRTSKVCKQWQGHRRRGQRQGNTRPPSTAVSGRVVNSNKNCDREGGGAFAEHSDEVRARESTENTANLNFGEERAAGDRIDDTFVANQSELIQRLGEMDEVGSVGWPTETGKEGVWARGERLWKHKVWPSIEVVVRSTLRAAQPHVRPRESSFQLFGFDLLLDHQLHPCERTAIQVEITSHVKSKLDLESIGFHVEIPFP